MIDALFEIIKEYEYGKYNLINEDIKLIVDTSYPHIAIIPFLIINPDAKVGNCSELSNSLYLRFKKDDAFKKTYFIVVSGNDPNYFTKEHGLAPHVFLIGSENKKILNASEKDFKNEDFLNETAPFVVDPSFKYVSMFKNSEYIINSIDKPKKESKENVYWLHGIDTPLAIENNKIISLKVNFSEKEFIQILRGDKRSTLYDFVQDNPNSKITPLVSKLNYMNPYAKRK